MTILSVYLDNWHDWPSTWDYLAKLQPAWVRIHQANARTIYRVQQVCPNANLLLRSWEIDDNNGDRKRELYANPIQAARDIIARWQGKTHDLTGEFERNGWQGNAAKWFWGLWNEPDPAHLPQIVQGTAEAMRLTDFPLGVLVPSVGNFGKPGEANSWELAKPLEAAIRDGGHILVCHEYWQPEGPSFVWQDEAGRDRHDAGSLAWRHHSIPMDVPILIGESGANGYIYNRHTNQDNGGWQNYMQPDQYAAQVREYIAGCDSRVQGVCLFMTDYHSDQWRTFDTTPAHGALLAVKDARPQPAPAVTFPVYAPVVSKPAPPKEEPMQTQPRALTWPAKGIVTQRFGENVDRYLAAFGSQGHNGLDIGGALGTPVLACAPGVVAWVGVDDSYGNYIRIWHETLGFHSFYAHLDAATVQAGQRVTQGQQIGRMGSTGNSTGPHLHYEVRIGTRDGYGQAAWGHSKGRVDPQTVLAVLGVV